MKNRSSSPRVVRAACLALGLSLLLASPGMAEDAAPAPDPVQLVNELAKVAADKDAAWHAKWDAYAAAKDAIAAEAESLEGQVDAEGEPVKGPAALRYEEIRKLVADSMRREELPVTGWIMAFFAASLLWGGFAVCIAIARKSGKHVDPDAD